MNEVKIKEKITKLADSGMLKKIIFIAGIAGIALILLSSVDFSAFSHKERDEEFSVKTYSTKIESDLESVISKIQRTALSTSISRTAPQRQRKLSRLFAECLLYVRAVTSLLWSSGLPRR